MESPLLPAETSARTYLHAGGEMGQRIRSFPWETTPLDAPTQWPPCLRYTLNALLQSGFPMLLLWGEELTCLYNDAYRAVLGTEGKHPHILGKPAHKAWPEVWPVIEPLLEKVRQHGETCSFEDMEAPFYRDGRLQTVYWTFSYSPVFGDTGSIEGVLVVCTETTRGVTRFRNLMQQFSDPAVLYRGPELIIVEANQPLLDFWKADRSIIGKPLAEVLPELKEQGFIDLLRNVYTSGESYSAQHVPSWFERTDGSKEQYYWNLHYNPWREPDGSIGGVMAMATDVTQQVLAQQKLTLAEDEMRVALEAADIGYWNVDPQSNTLKCNRKTKELFSLPPDEEVDLVLALSNIHPEDRPRVIKKIENALDHSSGGHYNTEYRVVNPADGSLAHVRAIGRTYFDEEQKPYRFSGTVQDITESKAVEEKLRAGEAELQSIKNQLELSMSAANIGTWHWNLDSQKLYWNPSQERLYGLEKGTFSGQVEDFMAFIVPEDLEKLRAAGRQLDEQPSGYSFRIRRTDGAIRWIQSRSRIVYHPDGSIARVTGINMDITDEKNAVDALRRSEEKYRSLFENMDQGFCIVEVLFDDEQTPFDYRFLEYNSRFTEQSGLNDAIGKTMRELVPDIEDAWPRYYGSVARSGVPIRFVDGSEVMGRWFDVFAFPTGESGQNLVAILFTDITEKRRAEERLREQQRLTSSILEAAPTLTYIYDLVQDGNVFASPQVLEILGYSSEEVKAMGASFLPDSIFPDDMSATQAHLGQLLQDRNDEIFGVEYRMRHKQGHLIWLFDRGRVFRRDEEGHPTQILGVATDITQLKQQQRFTQSIIEAAPSLTYIFDLVEKNNAYVSPQITEILGYSKTEVSSMGNNLLPTLLHPDDQIATNTRFSRLLGDTSDDIYEVEYRMRHKNGDWIWLFDRARVFRRNEEGRPEQILGVATEITTRKQTEAALQESESRFRMLANRLEVLVAERTLELQRSNEDLQQFAHVASHDLKEPVRKIRTFISRLELELREQLSERGRHYVDRVQNAAERMASMIDGVLKYSSFGAQELLFETVDLNEVAKDVENDLELVLQQKMGRIARQPLPSVTGSRVLLHQLFYNLFNNSLKFAREGVPPVVRIYTEIPEQSGELHIIVADNGIGFSETDARRIFGTFFRLHSKDQFEGTGLGLALCQKIVERHGGSIRAKGKPGEGATFIISLPAQSA